jgi:copper chaperone
MNIAIDGMHCQACVARVRKALESVEGARPERVEVGSAVVAVDAGHEQAVLEAVRKAGYEPHAAGQN